MEGSNPTISNGTLSQKWSFFIYLNFIKMGKTRDIGVLLNFQKQTKQQQNRELIAITKVIAGQGLAFRRE